MLNKIFNYSKKKVQLVFFTLLVDIFFIIITLRFPEYYQDFFLYLGLDDLTTIIYVGSLVVCVLLSLVLLVFLRNKFGIFLIEFRAVVKDKNVSEMARRFFVMNAFDGAMTMIGVVMGLYLGGGAEPRTVISSGVGTSLAMGLSGASGAYLSEKAESRRRVKELEEALFIDLEGSVLDRRSSQATLYLALVDALSPALSSLISIIPYFLSLQNIIDSTVATITSIVLMMILIFSLGLFLGKVSGEDILRYGFITLSIGLITFLLTYLLIPI
jgi:predicted membrane protein (TIGR00267 family)